MCCETDEDVFLFCKKKKMPLSKRLALEIRAKYSISPQKKTKFLAYMDMI